jgi:uncharacterized protein
MFEESLGRSPLCLTVPGLGNSGPGHWQTVWEAERSDCVWIGRIDQAVGRASAPVILVAHSLGCLALVWWASFVGEPIGGTIRGALLVAPPDVDHCAASPRFSQFAPAPKRALPFPSILIASRDDPYATIERSAEMASDWLCDFIDIGDAGHINAASGLGAWQEGQALLDWLIDEAHHKEGPTVPHARIAPGLMALPLR